MKITVTLNGYDRLEKMLQGITQGRDRIENEMLAAGANVVIARVKELPRPRSHGRSRNPKGHLLDNVRHGDAYVYGSGKAMDTSPQLKYRAGFAYAPLVEEGTRRMAAQPFLIPTFNSTADEQLDAMEAVQREGLGVK